MSADGFGKTRILASVAGTSPRADIVLLGTGQVGCAFLERANRLFGRADDSAFPHLRLTTVANTRQRIIDVGGIEPDQALDRLRQSESLIDEVQASLDRASKTSRIVVDATASDAIAERHAAWLAQGIHVVTANKLGAGDSISRWRSITDATLRSGTIYGDSATVGAGLPLLRTIRDLRMGGDAILGFAGVLSGTLAWLFDRYDGTQPFSECVREAREYGYTEPDPRIDLSGIDVKRKLLILARAAGIELEEHAVETTSLLTPELSAAPLGDWRRACSELDDIIGRRYRSAHGRNHRLCHVARWARNGKARIGLEALATDHPLAFGNGCDNRVLIQSTRYDDRPLQIRGPGAGPDVTAAALLDDIVRIALPRTQVTAKS